MYRLLSQDRLNLLSLCHCISYYHIIKEYFSDLVSNEVDISSAMLAYSMSLGCSFALLVDNKLFGLSTLRTNKLQTTFAFMNPLELTAYLIMYKLVKETWHREQF